MWQKVNLLNSFGKALSISDKESFKWKAQEIRFWHSSWKFVILMQEFVHGANICIIISAHKCVFESFVSFSAHFPSLPDVSFPHHWLLNENLLGFLRCTRVSALVSEQPCACVSLLQVPSQLLCDASNWRYFSLSGEWVCVCVCVLWLGMCYVGCRFLHVYVFCFCFLYT